MPRNVGVVLGLSILFTISAIFTKFYFPKIAAIQEKTLACVKVAFRQKTINILINKYIYLNKQAGY